MKHTSNLHSYMEHWLYWTPFTMCLHCAKDFNYTIKFNPGAKFHEINTIVIHILHLRKLSQRMTKVLKVIYLVRSRFWQPTSSEYETHAHYLHTIAPDLHTIPHDCHVRENTRAQLFHLVRAVWNSGQQTNEKQPIKGLEVISEGHKNQGRNRA